MGAGVKAPPNVLGMSRFSFDQVLMVSGFLFEGRESLPALCCVFAPQVEETVGVFELGDLGGTVGFVAAISDRRSSSMNASIAAPQRNRAECPQGQKRWNWRIGSSAPERHNSGALSSDEAGTFVHQPTASL